MGTATSRATPVLLTLSAPLAAAQWFVYPGQVGRTLLALGFVGALTLAYRMLPVRATDTPERQRACRDIQTGIFFATLMVALALAAKLGKTFGLIGNVDVSQRVTMVLIGAFIATTGNAIPKTLTPLTVLRCDPARVQAFHRFAGWTWTLTGLGVALAWLALPLEMADPATVAVLVAGMLLITTRLVVLRRSRRPRIA